MPCWNSHTLKETRIIIYWLFSFTKIFFKWYITLRKLQPISSLNYYLLCKTSTFINLSSSFQQFCLVRLFDIFQQLLDPDLCSGERRIAHSNWKKLFSIKFIGILRISGKKVFLARKVCFFMKYYKWLKTIISTLTIIKNTLKSLKAISSF